MLSVFHSRPSRPRDHQTCRAPHSSLQQQHHGKSLHDPCTRTWPACSQLHTAQADGPLLNPRQGSDTSLLQAQQCVQTSHLSVQVKLTMDHVVHPAVHTLRAPLCPIHHLLHGFKGVCSAQAHSRNNTHMWVPGLSTLECCGVQEGNSCTPSCPKGLEKTTRNAVLCILTNPAVLLLAAAATHLLVC